MKDYYAILGVLPSIDDVALTAVYRALLKKYHPDVFRGSSEDAHRITLELNEAYAVIGNPQRRAEYDRARKSQDAEPGDYDSQSASESDQTQAADQAIEQAWQFVVRYHPGAEQERAYLAAISSNLAFQFQIVLLERKNAEAYQSISRELKAEFLKRYFGSSAAVHEFVLTALAQGRRDVALEVNKAVKILGSPSSPASAKFIADVSKKCGWPAQPIYGGENNPALRILLAVAALVVVYAMSVWVASDFKPSPPADLVSPTPTVSEVSAPAKPPQPSYDCSTVSSQVLKLVCDTPELATLDSELAKAYSAAMAKTLSGNSVRDDERKWIQARNNGPADVSQLKQIYTDRISVLNLIAATPTAYLSAAMKATEFVTQPVVVSSVAALEAAMKEGGTIKVRSDLENCYKNAMSDTVLSCLAFDAAAENLLPGVESAANFPPTPEFVSTTYRSRAKDALATHGIVDVLEQDQILSVLKRATMNELSRTIPK